MTITEIRKIEEERKDQLDVVHFINPTSVIRSVNSYLGILQHTSTYNLRHKLFMIKLIMKICNFNSDITDKFCKGTPTNKPYLKAPIGGLYYLYT